MTTLSFLFRRCSKCYSLVLLQFVLLTTKFSNAWVVTQQTHQRPTTCLDAAVGIFYGTSTGNTFDCAEKIYAAFGSDVAAEPVDIDSLDKDALAEAFGEHNALIVGTPTWNTGADKQRSGTGWDELYYSKVPELRNVLQNKKVAVFGLGDQSSYGSNFADATGELYDVFTAAGCRMIDASWSQDGYEHEASKSIRDDKFCGLILDMINQEELTDERIEQWVAQLINNGILDDSTNGSTTSKRTTEVETAVAVSATPSSGSVDVTISSDIEARIRKLEEENAALRKLLEGKENGTHSPVGATSSSSSHTKVDDFIPYYNPVTRKTMWVSPDGRQSFIV